jgi:hypothetical protein
MLLLTVLKKIELRDKLTETDNFQRWRSFNVSLYQPLVISSE